VDVKRYMKLIFEAAASYQKDRPFYSDRTAILGPIVFGDMMQYLTDISAFTLTNWLARYINVFLWLPVANIFGAIIARIQEEENMCGSTLSRYTLRRTHFSSTDTAI